MNKALELIKKLMRKLREVSQTDNFYTIQEDHVFQEAWDFLRKHNETPSPNED